MAIKTIEPLPGEKDLKWNELLEVSVEALHHRIGLLDAINEQLPPVDSSV